MSERKSKQKILPANTDLRRRAASKGIFTLAELARRIPCSRMAVYFALEKPSRFPRVVRRIKELVDA